MSQVLKVPPEQAALILTLLEKVGEAALLIVDPVGVITYAGNRAVQLLGIQTEKLLGSSFYHSILLSYKNGGPIDRNSHPLNRALKEGVGQVVPFFCHYIHPDGNKTVLLAFKTTPVTEHGKVAQCIVQLRIVQRTVDIGEMKSLFVSFAAHQLKTPSGVVKGFLELMLRGGAKSFTADQWHFLVSAYEANEQLIDVSKMLLNLTRLEGGLVEPQIAMFYIRPVCEEKVAMYEMLGKSKNLKIVFEGPGKEVTFTSDRQLVAEIFGVLLSNGIKYAPENSQIRVHVEIENDLLSVEVTDEGPGLPVSMKEKIFNTPAAADNYSAGHGLGLRLARQYLALLKGSIEWKPNVPKGSKFKFSVPRV